MNNNIIIILLGLLLFSACEKDSIVPENQYYNSLSFPDSSLNHPKSSIYQGVLDDFEINGGLGVSIYIRDSYGTWIGCAGYADLVSDIKMDVGNQMLIASSSKIFTATAIFTLIDEGKLQLNDPVNKWIDKSITDRISNANESSIKHLLGHTSGIPDIFNIDHLMDYMNEFNNGWTDEDMLKYVYGKNATNKVGAEWHYSNVNYILLGMILEKASGLTLKEVYEQKIFNPLALHSAHYGVGDDALPPGLVKGYSDVNTNNNYVEVKDFYTDDVGYGGDGGISINAQDFGKFMDELMHGNIVSQNSLNEMQNWFNGGDSEDGKAGYGLYLYNDKYGVCYGHSGVMIGFESSVRYYPKYDITIVEMYNSDLILATKKYQYKVIDFASNLKEAIFN